ncbi:hypothetical protein PoB_005884100, partial [Plakobranchus ocellatus]
SLLFRSGSVTEQPCDLPTCFRLNIKLKTCLIQGATNECDADMGTYVAHIWDIAAFNQLAQLGCTQNVIQSRRYVKRALPMLSKRLAAISKLKLKKEFIILNNRPEICREPSVAGSSPAIGALA